MRWLRLILILSFSVLCVSFCLGACVSVHKGEPYGIILETTDEKAILAESLVEIEITALVKNTGVSGGFTINAVLTPVGHESLENSHTEYFEKDEERKVFFGFTLNEDSEYSYRVWISSSPGE